MPNGASVDQLYIEVNAKAQSANNAIDSLVGKLDRLSASLGKINGTNLTGLANGVQRLGNAMQIMNQIKTADFTRLANNLQKMGNIDVAKLDSAASSMSHLTRALNNIGDVSESDQKLGDLAKGIAQLGYTSSTKAIENIPKLADAMKGLMATLSKAPKVSQNIIDMTNALAKLARTGSSSGKAATSLSKSLSLFSNSSSTATKKSFNLASAIGKLYATYWLLFRAFSKLGDAINISSDLTEVQNVVDVTFGKYASLVEKMSETSITDFGMSELTVKQVSSRFQAMGTAMGFAQGKMADMSIELTKLTADMASFYNMEQSDVAEDLESVFTGQTRPLRTYGLDLTEATLKEWAMKQGLDANIDSMTQAEKTMLRYQYVMANTSAAQGDFLRTQDTWANQTRILKQNLEQLGSVIGGSLINASKPLVSALNVVIGKFTEFAQVVSDSLGKIFGWKYESGGGVTSDLETGEESADGISSGLGDAANNAKKLKNQLSKLDELNVINTQSDSGSGSGSGSGSASGATGTGTDGQWVRTESILDGYESELDTLYKLGEYISEKLTKALNDIDWDNVYQGARNFGKGLADFLNGLISPELFGAVGKTIANSLNTAIYAAVSFGETFDFEDLGKSLATGINEFFSNFDFGQLAKGLSIWASGLLEMLTGFIDKLEYEDIGKAFTDFVSNVDYGQLLVDAIRLSIKLVDLPSKISEEILKGLCDGIDLDKIKDSFAKAFKNFNLGEYIWSCLKLSLKLNGNETLVVFLEQIEKQVKQEIDNLERIFESVDFEAWWNEDVKPWFTIEKWKQLFNNIKIAISEKWNEVVNWWKSTAIYKWWNNDVKPFFTAEKWKENIGSIKDALSNKWNSAVNWWNKKPSLSNIKISVQNILSLLSSAWDKAKKWWKNNVKLSIPKLDFRVSFKSPSGVIQKAVVSALNLQGWPSLQFFASGGFPEDGWFRANHGEIMGKFDNGQSVVANNMQITEGISAAVYKGNRENNALIRQQIGLLQRQNELLLGILEKETGISADDIFSSVRKSADDYFNRTGKPVFQY